MYTIYFTPFRIGLYITSIWLLSFIVHLPNHFGWGTTRYSFMLRYCTFDTDLFSYLYFYSAVLVLAIIMAFIFYLKIYLVLRKSTLSKSLITGHKQDASNQSSAMSDEIKIIKTSFKIFILFLITWSPLCTLFLLHLMDEIPPWLYLYAALAAHGNSTLNFIVYFIENEMFRKAMKGIVYKLLNKKNKIDYNNPPTRTAMGPQSPTTAVPIIQIF